MNKHPDAELIRRLGGPTQLARKLGYALPQGSRRVHKWIKRGIPPRVKLEHPRLLTRKPRKRRRTGDSS